MIKDLSVADIIMAVELGFFLIALTLIVIGVAFNRLLRANAKLTKRVTRLTRAQLLVYHRLRQDSFRLDQLELGRHVPIRDQYCTCNDHMLVHSKDGCRVAHCECIVTGPDLDLEEIDQHGAEIEALILYPEKGAPK